MRSFGSASGSAGASGAAASSRTKDRRSMGSLLIRTDTLLPSAASGQNGARTEQGGHIEEDRARRADVGGGAAHGRRADRGRRLVRLGAEGLRQEAGAEDERGQGRDGAPGDVPQPLRDDRAPGGRRPGRAAREAGRPVRGDERGGDAGVRGGSR